MPQGFGGEQEERTQSLWELIDDRMRGRWGRAITLGVILSAVLAVLGYLSAEPMYQSVGTIEVSPQARPVLQKIPDEHDMPYYDRFMATQETYVRSREVLEQALQQEELAKVGLTRDAASLAVLRDGLNVERDRQSQLIFVVFESPDPAIAPAAVNAVLDAYYERYGQYSGSHIHKIIEELTGRQATLQRELNTLETERTQIVVKYNATDLAPLQQLWLEELAKLDSTIREGKRILARVEARGGATSGEQLIAPSLEALLQVNPKLRILRGNLDQAITDFESVRGRLNPETRLYASAEKRLELAQQRYDAEYEVAVRAWEALPDAQRAQEPGMIVSADYIVALEGEYKALQEKQRALTGDSARLREIDYERNRTQTELEQTRSRIELFEIELPALTKMITISQRGHRTDEPTSDARKSRAVMGAGFGFMVAFGLFFLLGSIDRRAYGASQLQSVTHTGLPACLGVLPDLGDSFTDPESGDVASHCVHQIRNQIEAVRSPEPGYVLAISSPFQGDGKTSIVMALGWSYAAAGFNTLLVDCDMVGRSLTRQLALTGRDGLKEALLTGELNGSVSRLPIDNLSAVSVGVDKRFGPENVRRADLEQVLAQVRDKYDIIIVDTGPMLGSLESTPVTAVADGVVLSVRRGRSRGRLEDCVNRLQLVGTQCVGVILNCAVRADCNRYVSEASLAAAEEDRAGRRPDAAEGNGSVAAAAAAPGERNALVRAVQNASRSRTVR